MLEIGLRKKECLLHGWHINKRNNSVTYLNYFIDVSRRIGDTVFFFDLGTKYYL